MCHLKKLNRPNINPSFLHKLHLLFPPYPSAPLELVTFPSTIDASATFTISAKPTILPGSKLFDAELAEPYVPA